MNDKPGDDHKPRNPDGTYQARGPNGEQPWGAPKRNKNRLTHGLVALGNSVARRTRRGRDRIDRRTAEGREALDLRGKYIEDKGGMENLSTGQFMAVVSLSEVWWLRAMGYGAIAKYLRKNPHLAANPKAIA